MIRLLFILGYFDDSSTIPFKDILMIRLLFILGYFDDSSTIPLGIF